MYGPNEPKDPSSELQKVLPAVGELASSDPCGIPHELATSDPDISKQNQQNQQKSMTSSGSSFKPYRPAGASTSIDSGTNIPAKAFSEMFPGKQAI